MIFRDSSSVQNQKSDSENSSQESSRSLFVYIPQDQKLIPLKDGKNEVFREKQTLKLAKHRSLPEFLGHKLEILGIFMLFRKMVLS